MSAIAAKWEELNENYANFGVLATTFIILIVMLVLLTLASDHFLSTRNLRNILTQTAIYFVMGTGMTLILTLGEIDISVGSVIGLSVSFIGATAMEYGMPWYVAIFVGLLVGLACGVFNGFFVVKFGVPSIIVTIGSMTMFRGLAYYFMEGSIYYGLPAQILWFARGTILGVPVPIWISGIVLGWGYYFLNYTKTGRYITAVGGNEDAAELAGINKDKIRFMVFSIMGLLVGVASLIYVARVGSAEAVAGQGMEIHTIASVVVGGTSLFGGKGLILGTLMGALILGVLENGLLLAGFSFYLQRVMLGIIFILVVAYRAYTTAEK